MSGVVGTPQLVTIAAIALGGASGVAVAVGNSTPGILNSVLVSFVTGATIGNRALYMALRTSAAGANFWIGNPGVNQAASLTGNYAWGQNVALGTAAAGIAINYAPIPRGILLPPNAFIAFVDNAGLSGTDTVAAVLQLTY